MSAYIVRFRGVDSNPEAEVAFEVQARTTVEAESPQRALMIGEARIETEGPQQWPITWVEIEARKVGS